MLCAFTTCRERSTAPAQDDVKRTVTAMAGVRNADAGDSVCLGRALQPVTNLCTNGAAPFGCKASRSWLACDDQQYPHPIPHSSAQCRVERDMGTSQVVAMQIDAAFRLDVARTYALFPTAVEYGDRLSSW